MSQVNLAIEMNRCTASKLVARGSVPDLLQGLLPCPLPNDRVGIARLLENTGVLGLGMITKVELGIAAAHHRTDLPRIDRIIHTDQHQRRHCDFRQQGGVVGPGSPKPVLRR